MASVVLVREDAGTVVDVAEMPPPCGCSAEPQRWRPSVTGRQHVMPRQRALGRLTRLATHTAAPAAAAPAQQPERQLPTAPDAAVLRAAFEIVPWTEVQRAAEKFRAYGFCLLGEALPPDSLQLLRSAAGEVFDEVGAFDTQRSGSRGAARYGLGSMTSHPQWAAHLIDNPRVLPVVDEIWGHSRCELLRCGMNGSFPGSGACDRVVVCDIVRARVCDCVAV